MKSLNTVSKLLLSAITLLIIAFSSGCSPMSEIIEDKAKGINGSFEYSDKGLPVNWHIYSNKTVPDGNFEIQTDDKVFHDGSQSLKFSVNSCSNSGGRFSPGLFQEFPALQNENYSIRFWIKNTGCKFRVSVSGVSAKDGQNTLPLLLNDAIPDWKQFELNCRLPDKMDRIRFELNILEPGTLWIDGITIQQTKV